MTESDQRALTNQIMSNRSLYIQCWISTG